MKRYYLDIRAALATLRTKVRSVAIELLLFSIARYLQFKSWFTNLRTVSIYQFVI